MTWQYIVLTIWRLKCTVVKCLEWAPISLKNVFEVCMFQLKIWHMEMAYQNIPKTNGFKMPYIRPIKYIASGTLQKKNLLPLVMNKNLFLMSSFCCRFHFCLHTHHLAKWMINSLKGGIRSWDCVAPWHLVLYIPMICCHKICIDHKDS